MSDDLREGPVTLYWRTGCPFSPSSRWRLQQLGVATTEVDIWQDRDAAAALPAVAGGNETVPTMVVTGEAMVNPTGPEVLDAVRRLAPAAHRSRRTGGGGVHPTRRLVAAWAVVAVAVAASVTVDVLGRHGLSWAFDGLAVAAYLVAVARRRRGRPGSRGEAARSPGGVGQGRAGR